jgi:hypothetical protein
MFEPQAMENRNATLVMEQANAANATARGEYSFSECQKGQHGKQKV